MAIIFNKQKKKQNILIIVFLVTIAVTLFILWQGMFKEETFFFPEESSAPPLKNIEINFGIFEKVKNFQPFAEIQPLEEESGRENPFLPYY